MKHELLTECERMLNLIFTELCELIESQIMCKDDDIKNARISYLRGQYDVVVKMIEIISEFDG